MPGQSRSDGAEAAVSRISRRTFAAGGLALGCSLAHAGTNTASVTGVVRLG